MDLLIMDTLAIYQYYGPNRPLILSDLRRIAVNIWEADLETNKAPKPILPIVFYHGEKKWHQKPFQASFGEVGEVFQAFIPKFDYHLTNLSHYPDEVILGLKRGFLVNSFLVMKHKSEQAYILNNVEHIFIGLNF